MKFVVRYWSSLLPKDFQERRQTQRWVDYSVHPGTKLGLHNAMLAVHDRSEIMQAHGCRFECAVFVIEGEHCERLSPESAARLFMSLPRGDVKWLDIREFLLPVAPNAPVTVVPAGGASPNQLSLFPHVHTPYDDTDVASHLIDVDT